MTSSLSALAKLGEIVYVTTLQTNTHIYAVITDGSTPNLNTISIDVSADEAAAIVPGLVGKTGAAGAPQFALDLQPDVFSSPASLPDDLTTTDFGKYWLLEQTDEAGNVVSAAAYVWWNTYWRVVPFGTRGPTGPVPNITPDVILIDPDASSYVQNSGTIANPSWTFYLAVPQGPPGPEATLAGCPDVDETTAPTPGQVLGYNGQYKQGLPVWKPMTVGAMNPLPFIVPESSFTSYTGITATHHTVCTFAVPAQPWAWKPVVFGQIQASGSQLSLSPLLLDVEVLLGDAASGTMVGVGHGNAFGGVITILPQTSTGGTTATSDSAAMTPTNSTALVPANHTGTQGTLYVNLKNQGLAGVYNYNAANSQLFVLVVPATTEGAVQLGLFGSLSTKVTLSAWSVTQGSWSS